MSNKEKKAAHRVLKLFKACEFNVELLNKKFTISNDDKTAYNKIYGWMGRI